MAGFVTARDGVYTVMQDITGSTSGYFRAGYDFDRRSQTDAAGEGFPYYTVSPAFDKNVPHYVGTQNNRLDYTIIVRLFDLYTNDASSETSFLTLVDLTLTTLMRNAKIDLNDTVISCLVENVRTGYNDDTQPTARIAEIELTVRQLHSRL